MEKAPSCCGFFPGSLGSLCLVGSSLSLPGFDRVSLSDLRLHPRSAGPASRQLGGIPNLSAHGTSSGFLRDFVPAPVQDEGGAPQMRPGLCDFDAFSKHGNLPFPAEWITFPLDMPPTAVCGGGCVFGPGQDFPPWFSFSFARFSSHFCPRIARVVRTTKRMAKVSSMVSTTWMLSRYPQMAPATRVMRQPPRA